MSEQTQDFVLRAVSPSLGRLLWGHFAGVDRAWPDGRAGAGLWDHAVHGATDLGGAVHECAQCRAGCAVLDVGVDGFGDDVADICAILADLPGSQPNGRVNECDLRSFDWRLSGCLAWIFRACRRRTEAVVGSCAGRLRWREPVVDPDGGASVCKPAHTSSPRSRMHA